MIGQDLYQLPGEIKITANVSSVPGMDLDGNFSWSSASRLFVHGAKTAAAPDCFRNSRLDIIWSVTFGSFSSIVCELI